MERWIKLIIRFVVAFLHVLSSRMEARYMPLFVIDPFPEDGEGSGGAHEGNEEKP